MVLVWSMMCGVCVEYGVLLMWSMMCVVDVEYGVWC